MYIVPGIRLAVEVVAIITWFVQANYGMLFPGGWGEFRFGTPPTHYHAKLRKAQSFHADQSLNPQGIMGLIDLAVLEN